MDVSCHMRMSHVTCEWVVSHVEMLRRDITLHRVCLRHFSPEWVLSHLNESCHIWMSHVTYEWVMPHLHESCHKWMSHVACEWVMSHMQLVCIYIALQWVYLWIYAAFCGHHGADIQGYFARVRGCVVCEDSGRSFADLRLITCRAGSHWCIWRSHLRVGNKPLYAFICIHTYNSAIMFAYANIHTRSHTQTHTHTHTHTHMKYAGHQ